MEKHVICRYENKTLHGTMHIPDLNQKEYPMVIISHGFCGDRNEVNFVHTQLSRLLCQNGIASVRFDFYGSGESEGGFEDFTLSSEVDDVAAILDYVSNLDFVDLNRIALHGLSLGGLVSSLAAGLHPDSVCALSMWCPASNYISDMKNKNVAGIDLSQICTEGFADLDGLKISKAAYEDALTWDIDSVVSNLKKPVNIVHGTGDIAAPYTNSLHYLELYEKDQARLLLVPDADHRFSSLEWKQVRFRSALGFFKKVFWETAEYVG